MSVGSTKLQDDINNIPLADDDPQGKSEIYKPFDCNGQKSSHKFIDSNVW